MKRTLGGVRAALFLMLGAWPMVAYAQANLDRASTADPLSWDAEDSARARLAPADSCELEGITRSVSGLPLPQTWITVHSVNDNVTHNVLSGPNGQYLIFDLRPGRYELIANKSGYSASSQIAVELEPRQNLRVDLTLKAGSAEAEPEPASPAYPGAKTPDRTETERYLLEEVQRLEARLAELETRLASNAPSAVPAGSALPTATAVTASNDSTAVTQPAGTPAPSSPTSASSRVAAGEGASTPPQAAPAEKPKASDPFAFADFTWLNGNARTKEAAMDTKFFTPEVRADIDYVYDFNHPADHTIGRVERGLPVAEKCR